MLRHIDEAILKLDQPEGYIEHQQFLSRLAKCLRERADMVDRAAMLSNIDKINRDGTLGEVNHG